MDPIAKPVRRKREKLCDFCKAVYTCNRREHGRSPECDLGQMKLLFESIRKDTSEENSFNLNMDIQQFSNNINNNNENNKDTSFKPELT